MVDVTTLAALLVFFGMPLGEDGSEIHPKVINVALNAVCTDPVQNQAIRTEHKLMYNPGFVGSFFSFFLWQSSMTLKTFAELYGLSVAALLKTPEKAFIGLMAAKELKLDTRAKLWQQYRRAVQNKKVN